MKKTLIILLLVAAAICAAILIYLKIKSKEAEKLPPANLYIAGDFGSGEMETDTAYYMVNDSMVILSPAGARVSGIYYYNKDVYVSGIYNNDGLTTPCYWKNRELVTLPVEKNSAYTSGIFVNENGVYVSGHINYDEVTPCYWHNDSLVVLPGNEDESCFTRAVFAEDTNVYVVGYTTYFEDNYLHINACSWINNEKIPLDTVPSVFSIATHIVKADTNLYVSGRSLISDSAYASIWKNGVRKDMYPVLNEMPETSVQIFNTFESSDFIMFGSYYGSLSFPEMKIVSFTVAGENTYTMVEVDDSIICLFNETPFNPIKDTIKAEVKCISVCPGDTLIAGINIHEEEEIIPVTRPAPGDTLTEDTGPDSLYLWRNNRRKGIIALDSLKDRGEYFFIGRVEEE